MQGETYGGNMARDQVEALISRFFFRVTPFAVVNS